MGQIGNMMSIAVDPVTPADIYIGGANFHTYGQECVYVSHDYGQTLTKYKGCIAGDVRHMEVAPALCSTVYASSRYGGLFKSEDSGATWEVGHNGINAQNILTIAMAPSQPERPVVKHRSPPMPLRSSTTRP